MATMIPEIPEGVEAFQTEGERRFYRFLEQVARPDREFVAWYTPDVEGREESRPSPLRQAREYKNQILERLRKERILCLAGDPRKVSVAWGPPRGAPQGGGVVGNGCCRLRLTRSR